GEIWVVFLAVIMGLPLPLLPLQILLMNLITDGLPALALSAEPTDEGIMQRPPRPPDASPLNLQTLVFLLIFGLIMGIGSLFLYHRGLSEGLDKARTVAFTALVMFEMFAVLGVRSIRPFGRINPLSNMWLFVAVGSSIALQVLLVYAPPLQRIFKTVPLTLLDWGWIALVSSLGFIVMEVSKFFVREESFQRS
ncbi:MAG: cation transporting ATPase C-terminal domain-containing protein, partial [Myxococcales bacterium]|nr:cation transporting ATPase C-terminal domain-containing protein [Myxococcales bacterium]